ncbi:NAD-dependent epimerase/dehydratase family protein [Streptomyces sp. NPDC020817]|uniref:NAD-dependent epimerase/dehydratase family protein n=1 Tax=Streptomyces sp. NPDC020817 TaxID=3365095 RepID=UPI0037AB2460
MSRYRVTGGAGYIGGVAVAHLLEAGHRVTDLDDLSTCGPQAVPADPEFVRGGPGHAAALLPAGYAAVLHYAASSQVAESVRDPDKNRRNSVTGPPEPMAAMPHADVRTRLGWRNRRTDLDSLVADAWAFAREVTA